MRTIGIYPGQFQPPHLGHKKAYEKLRMYAGPDTFVVTTDFDPSIEAPLHFGDKEQILVRHGIPASHIRKVKNIRNPIEVLENFDPETTVVIYALSRADAMSKFNETRYYKPFSSIGSKPLSYKNQAYVIIIDDNITAKDKEGHIKVYTSKNIREALGSNRFTKNQKETWFKQFFGWFDLGLFELLKNKYTQAHQSDIFDPESEEELPPVEPETPEKIKEILSNEIINILNELMGPPPSIATDSSYGPDSVAVDGEESAADKQKNDAELRKSLQQQKSDMERQDKLDQAQLKRDKASVDDLRKRKLPDNREKITAINKQMTQI